MRLSANADSAAQNKATPPDGEAKRAILTAVLSISSYSERQKRANSKKSTDE